MQEPQKTSPDALFGILSSFVEAYQGAVKENIAMREKELKEKRHVVEATPL